MSGVLRGRRNVRVGAARSKTSFTCALGRRMPDIRPLVRREVARASASLLDSQFRDAAFGHRT